MHNTDLPNRVMGSFIVVLTSSVAAKRVKMVLNDPFRHTQTLLPFFLPVLSQMTSKLSKMGNPTLKESLKEGIHDEVTTLHCVADTPIAINDKIEAISTIIAKL